MSHPLNLLQELLLTLFLALGCAWFAIDLARKLHAPQSESEPKRAPSSAPAPVVAAAPSSASDAAPSPATVPAPVAIAPPAPVAAAEPLVAGVPAAHLAAITAAVHHLFKGRVRLASVLPSTATAAAAPIDWAREGRRDIFTSHRVR